MGYRDLYYLLLSVNPETGSISYSYDADGNVRSRTNALGVVTNYTYDALDRLISKTYTNAPAGTLSNCYQYDNAASGANGVGHLWFEWTQPGSCSSIGAPPASGYQSLRVFGVYDAMGRVVSEQQCAAGYCTSASVPTAPPVNCSSLSNISGLQYCYNLAGNVLAYGNGVTVAAAGQYPQQEILFSQTFDSAGRLASVSSSWSDSTHPSTLFSTPVYAPFGPLSSWLLGQHLVTNRSYDRRLRITGQSSTQQ